MERQKEKVKTAVALAYDKMGNPKEAVDRKKQKKISMTASYYLMRKCGRMDIPCRFDVAAVLGEQIEVVKNAFEYLP